MRVFNLIVKEIKQLFRDKQGMVLMTVFPLVLTIVLGFALSGMYAEAASPSKIESLYAADESSELGRVFKEQFVPESEKNNLKLTEISDIEKGKKEVQVGNSYSFIHITDGGITIYAREGSSDASLVEMIMKGFARTYDAYVSIAVVDPAVFQQIQSQSAQASEQPEFTVSRSLDRSKQPSAMDYYAVTMITLIIMYASIGGSQTITTEKNDRTLTRIYTTPVTNGEILTSKVIGNVIGTMLQILFVFLIDSIFLKANFGSHLLPLAAVLFSQIIMVIAFGVGMGYLFKNSASSITIIQTIIPILVFLGGGYVNLELMGVTGFISKLALISPVKWINRTILQIIYANDLSSFVPTVLICLVTATIFIGISAALSRKEAHA